MALWRCEKCGSAYSVGAESCPECGGKKHHEVGAPKPVAKKQVVKK